MIDEPRILVSELKSGDLVAADWFAVPIWLKVQRTKPSRLPGRTVIIYQGGSTRTKTDLAVRVLRSVKPRNEEGSK